MSKLDRNFRAAVSFALALIVASAATLSSVAASNGSKAATREKPDGRFAMSVANALMGRLTGSGHFTIDGDEAQPGATVLSGSSVATGPDGEVTIDFGSLGQIVLRPETAIRLTLLQNEVEVRLERAGSILQVVPAGVMGRMTIQGGNTRLGVSRGEAEVNWPGSARTLQAGEIMALDQTAQVITKGDATITAEANATKSRVPAPSQAGIDTAGLAGVIALAGTATAITLAVVSGRNHSNSPIPPRPSGVTP
jgi:hypothetical protein